MKVKDMVSVLSLSSKASCQLDCPVQGGYVSDLLSNVMANAKQGDVWITMQAHQNIIAVASLLGLSAVVIAGGAQPDQATIDKAVHEGINLFTTNQDVFAVAGILYEQGVGRAC